MYLHKETKMMFQNILFVLLLTKMHKLSAEPKLFYQTDMSEYCKRRVFPSVFLAKNSNSPAYIMHFSPMELPFSCSVSVRTESGNNIILVTQIIRHKLDMRARCETGSPEVLIYEMGETFGGYWGQLGQNVFNKPSTKSKTYTLKTPSRFLKESPEPVPLVMTHTTTATTAPDVVEDSEDDDFISIDLPLVNVSAKFIGIGQNETELEDEDAMFDLEYDVTPEPGVSYSTSVIPIVEFSIKNHTSLRKEGGDDVEPRFDLDIVEKYTPDHRLTTPNLKYVTGLKYRKLLPRITTKRRHQYFRKDSTKVKLQTHRFTSHKYANYVFPTWKTSESLRNVSRLNSWNTIDELIKKVNLTASLQEDADKKLSIKENKILQEISDVNHNFSIYRVLDLSQYDSSKSRASTTVKKTTFPTTEFKNTQTTTTTTKHYSIKEKKINKVTSTLTELTTRTSTSVSHSSLKNLSNVPREIYENYYLKGLSTSSIVSKGTDHKSMTAQKSDKLLVNHKSWENVVQSAQDMAVLLNTTKDEIKKQNVVTNNRTAHKSLGLRRRKREMYAIEIGNDENASPRNITTQSPILRTAMKGFGMAEKQEFSRLIEVQDDDLYGRVSLQLLRQFVGPVLYNICDFDLTPTMHHVHLLNTSKIVIAINNFTTLASLTMFLTTAQALIGEAECPESTIECQVAGARACIDQTVACDGVPNCGSYSIYDEDRLMCGVSEGLQHNVFTAAFTFLAVLLTLLYTVHYWLKRCVPKVADAFFVYTNGTDNVLFLEPLMRSPHDYDTGSKTFYHPSMFSEDDVHDITEVKKPNCWKSFMRILTCGFIARKSSTEKQLNSIETGNFDDFQPKNKYSFTQLEIQKIIEQKMASNQAENYIELTDFNKKRNSKQIPSPAVSLLKPIDSILTLEEPLPEDYKDELGMLKFLKNSRNSLLSVSKTQAGVKEDYSTSMDKVSEEITNIDYNRFRLGEPGPSKIKPKKVPKKEQLPPNAPPTDLAPQPGPSGIGKKRLRFDDNTTMIPASIAEVDEDEDENSKSGRHGNFLDTMMGKQKFFTALDNTNESRFWGGKGKAKKPHKSTR